MTTTSERLLQLAAEHDQKAAALRLAATELNGHRTEKKQARAEQTIEKAITLRRKQQSYPERHKQRHKTEQVTEILHDRLTSVGRQSTRELQSHLLAYHINLGRDRVRKLVTSLPGAHLEGEGKLKRWALNGGVAKARKVYPSIQAKKAASLDKARIVAGILQEGGPMRIQDLTETARAKGVPSLTGIYNYVKMGYLKRSGGKKGHYRYSYKAMPPETADAAVS